MGREQPIENRQSAMIWRTWHDLNVRPRPSQSRALRSAELQVRTFAIANCRLPSVLTSFRSSVADDSIGNWQSAMIWRKGQESNLQATSAVVFGTTALPVRLP